MADARLNLTSLRAPGAFGGFVNPRLSRRSLLGLSGAAVASTSALGRTWQAGFGLRRDGRAAELCLGPRVAWRIDPAAYDGRANLVIDESAERIVLQLTDARWPGCELPADLTCELLRQPGGWMARVTLPGGFTAEGRAEPWLAGDAPLRGRADLSGRVCRLGSGELRLTGPAEARLDGDGSLSLRGDGLVALSLPGAELTADGLALSVAGDDAPSLFESPPARRTAMAILRGERAWSVEPEVRGHAWRLCCGAASFDSALIETAAGRAAVVFEGDGEPVEFRPDGVRGEADEFALLLRRPRYAASFNRRETHAALTAAVDTAPVWLTVGGCSLEVAGLDACPFEAVTRGGVTETLS